MVECAVRVIQGGDLFRAIRGWPGSAVGPQKIEGFYQKKFPSNAHTYRTNDTNLNFAMPRKD